jgi:hypothetical protein
MQGKIACSPDRQPKTGISLLACLLSASVLLTASSAKAEVINMVCDHYGPVWIDTAAKTVTFLFHDDTSGESKRTVLPVQFDGTAYIWKAANWSAALNVSERYLVYDNPDSNPPVFQRSECTIGSAPLPPEAK